MRGIRRAGLVCSIAIVAAVFPVVSQATAGASVVQCGNAPPHYHAAVEGPKAGNVAGTAAGTTLPSSWYVDGGDTEDVWAQAAFIIGPVINGRATAVEAGFFSGWWPYDDTVAFQYGAIPYYTLNSGDGTGQGFNTTYTYWGGANIGMFAWTAGVNTTPAFAHTGAQAFDLGNYSVLAPRKTQTQGEVFGATTTWMGGYPYEVTDSYWTADAANWWLWQGFTRGCYDPPYSLQELNNTFEWLDSGHG